MGCYVPPSAGARSAESSTARLLMSDRAWLSFIAAGQIVTALPEHLHHFRGRVSHASATTPAGLGRAYSLQGSRLSSERLRRLAVRCFDLLI